MKIWFVLLILVLLVLPFTACSMESVERMERVPFEDMVVVDNEECTVTITDIRVSGSYQVDFLLVNKSTEDMGITADSYLNGVYWSMANWDSESAVVHPGEQGTITMDFLNMRELSIGAVTDMVLEVSPGFVELTEDGWLSYRSIGEETVHIYPYGEENATVYEYVPKENHRVLVDNEYMTLISVGNSSMGDSKLYLHNHTDRNVLLRAVNYEAILNGGVEGSVHVDISAPAGAQAFGLVFPVWPGNEGDGVHEYIKTDTITLTLELMDMMTGEILYTAEPCTLSPSGMKITE